MLNAILFAVLIFSAGGECAALPGLDSSPPNKTLAPRVRLTNWAGCVPANGANRRQLAQAFKDASLIASKALINIDFNEAAAIEFFGPPAVNRPNQNIIRNNFKRAAAYKSKWSDWITKSCVTVVCNDPDHACASRNLVAYHVQPEPRPYPLLNFCPLFFDYPSLAAAVSAAESTDTTNLDNFYENQGLFSSSPYNSKSTQLAPGTKPDAPGFQINSFAPYIDLVR
ncbi:hypothetical protein C8R44DRAFT_751085 [Mycena epipterygia]|nr:hypothetical protein C8R44DRAFT_751085 [Mycena epipterygia]